MKRRTPWTLLAPLLLLGSAPVSADVRSDYARQWSLTLPDADAGAYRVVLDREVYRSLHAPALQDLDVLDAAGVPMPAAVVAAVPPRTQAPERVALPWFTLPTTGGSDAVDLSVISQRDAAGAVLRVETRTMPGPPRAEAFLVDASRLHGPVAALVLDWETGRGSFDLAYRVEGSEDLRRWRVLEARASLVDLARGDDHLRQQRVPVGAQQRYLRLVPLQDAPGPVLSAVHAELPSARPAAAWAWETVLGQRVDAADGGGFVFEVSGRFPVEQVDLALEGNAAAEWSLSSRDDPAAAWRHRAGPWMAYQLQGEGDGDRSSPQSLDAPVRDRYWRLLPQGAASDGVPALRLGYRPETVVFLAQGAGPYALVAGSARAQRGEAPIARMLEALRTQRGADWHPPHAELGSVTELAGDAALQLQPPPRDWKTWVLWALLVGGAGLVTLFAVSLLRRRA